MGCRPGLIASLVLSGVFAVPASAITDCEAGFPMLSPRGDGARQRFIASVQAPLSVSDLRALWVKFFKTPENVTDADRQEGADLATAYLGAVPRMKVDLELAAVLHNAAEQEAMMAEELGKLHSRLFVLRQGKVVVAPPEPDKMDQFLHSLSPEQKAKFDQALAEGMVPMGTPTATPYAKISTQDRQELLAVAKRLPMAVSLRVGKLLRDIDENQGVVPPDHLATYLFMMKDLADLLNQRLPSQN